MIKLDLAHNPTCSTLAPNFFGVGQVPHAQRIQHLETDTADSVRALNVGANVMVARMVVVEQQVSFLTEILVSTAGGLNESIAASRTLRNTVEELYVLSAIHQT